MGAEWAGEVGAAALHREDGARAALAEVAVREQEGGDKAVDRSIERLPWILDFPRLCAAPHSRGNLILVFKQLCAWLRLLSACATAPPRSVDQDPMADE